MDDGSQTNEMDGGTHAPAADGGARPAADEDVDIEAVQAQLESLAETVDADHEREAVEKTMGLVGSLTPASVRGRIRAYTRRDIAESFVGSILISLPLLVEDGVYDIGTHFVETPAYIVLNAAFVVAMSAGLLYYAEFRSVAVHRPLFGVIPRRLLAVLVISFTTAAFMMTLWGRVEGWSDPAVAIARISVIWTAAAFGAALGDILPGESSGADIHDELGEFGERFGIGDDEGRF